MQHGMTGSAQSCKGGEVLGIQLSALPHPASFSPATLLGHRPRISTTRSARDIFDPP
jgi:hypothetical protein